ncbi:hypothetical protein R3P38DRAFT_3298867 [Favolaschia claudopus]|uniref:Uncharacterized protein n=1 Tax=Favolaschia claudopus TaxID=2862362 RepID=A0AAV9Z2G7_9AGAR
MSDVEMPPANQGTKRRREGSSERTGQPAKRTAVASQEASAAGFTAATSLWTLAYQQSVTDRIRVPPTLVQDAFCTKHDEALKEYQSAQKQFQKAQVTLERFNQARENGATPSMIAHAIKGPVVQLLKGTPALDSIDADTANAKSILDEAIDAARKNATDYLQAIYAAQVEHCRTGVNVQEAADRLVNSVKEYTKEIVESSQDVKDVHIWDAYIDRLRAAFVIELTNLSFDFAAKIRQESANREANANAVETARIAAETEKAAKPIKDLVEEIAEAKIASVNTFFTERFKSIQQDLDSQKTVKASSSNNNAQASSSKKKDTKAKKATQDGGKNTNHADAEGGGSSKKKGKGKKGKGKQKAKDNANA